MKAGLYALLIALIALLAIATPIRALADHDGHYARYENGYPFDHGRDDGWAHKHHYRAWRASDDRGRRICKHKHGRYDCGPRPGYRWNPYGAIDAQPEHYFGYVTNNSFQPPFNRPH